MKMVVQQEITHIHISHIFIYSKLQMWLIQYLFVSVVVWNLSHKLRSVKDKWTLSILSLQIVLLLH